MASARMIFSCPTSKFQFCGALLLFSVPGVAPILVTSVFHWEKWKTDPVSVEENSTFFGLSGFFVHVLWWVG